MVCLGRTFNLVSFYHNGAVFEVGVLGKQTNKVNERWREIPEGIAHFRLKGTQKGQLECNGVDLVPLRLWLDIKYPPLLRCSLISISLSISISISISIYTKVFFSSLAIFQARKGTDPNSTQL